MTDLELVRELGGDTCRCRHYKKPGTSFCSACYYTLPMAMRYRLYDRLGKGYREAYEAATSQLDAQAKGARA